MFFGVTAISITTAIDETPEAIVLVPETNDAVVLPQHFVLDLLEDDGSGDPFSALHGALVLTSCPCCRGPPTWGYARGRLTQPFGHLRHKRGIEGDIAGIRTQPAVRHAVWLIEHGPDLTSAALNARQPSADSFEVSYSFDLQNILSQILKHQIYNPSQSKYLHL